MTGRPNRMGLGWIRRMLHEGGQSVGWFLLGLVAIASIASITSVASAQSAPPTQDSGLDREARLGAALGDYARALSESDRDARLAGFARAERAFASLISDGVETAPLWTNLGNAALQAQHPGQAVLAFHRALLLEPGNTTAQQNLAHIRSRLPSWVPRPDGAEGAEPLFFYRGIAPEIRSLVAALAFCLAGLCFAISVRRREGAWRGLAILAGVGWGAIFASVVYDLNSADSHLAVLTNDEVLARSADSSLAPLALPEPLPAGVEVDQLEERADWSRVRLSNGRDVWILSSSVTRVAD